MKSLFDFIVEPVGKRYNNEVKVGDKSLIINTQVETFKSVNNIAKVIEIPLFLAKNLSITNKSNIDLKLSFNTFKKYCYIKYNL